MYVCLYQVQHFVNGLYALSGLFDSDEWEEFLDYDPSDGLLTPLDPPIDYDQLDDDKQSDHDLSDNNEHGDNEFHNNSHTNNSKTSSGLPDVHGASSVYNFTTSDGEGEENIRKMMQTLFAEM